MSATEAPISGGSPVPNSRSNSTPQSPVSNLLKVRKRSGETVSFDSARIRSAIEKAFRAELELNINDTLPDDVAGRVKQVADAVLAWCQERPENLAVESIQDEVER